MLLGGIQYNTLCTDS